MRDETLIGLWLEGYLMAWRDDSAENITAIFEPGASYFTDPRSTPHVGHDAIVAYWTGESESSIPWTFEGGVIAGEGPLYVIQGVTTYPQGGDGKSEQVIYDNIWLVQLADTGRATQFVEYWMRRG